MTKPKFTERDLQISFVEWYRSAYPSHALLLFSIPNGAIRSAAAMAAEKKAGLLPGAADLFLCRPSLDGKYHGLFIEVKIPGREARQNQLEFGRRAMEQGYVYVVVTSLYQFSKLIKEYAGRTGQSELDFERVTK